MAKHPSPLEVIPIEGSRSAQPCGGRFPAEGAVLLVGVADEADSAIDAAPSDHSPGAAPIGAAGTLAQ